MHDSIPHATALCLMSCWRLAASMVSFVVKYDWMRVEQLTEWFNDRLVAGKGCTLEWRKS